MGYLGNRKLIAADEKIQVSVDQIIEMQRCLDSVEYFCENYVKIVNVDRGLINFDLYDYQKRLINLAVAERFTICKLPRQTGKALDVDTPILTPSGFKLLDELQVGDLIYGPDGQTTTITFITDTMYNHDVFEVCFDNGDVIKADKEHLWEVSSTNWNSKSKTLTTEQLIPFLNHTNKPFVQFTAPVVFEEKELLIDPYQLGVWLGDGATNGASITCHIDDLEHYKTKMSVGNVWIDSRNANVVYFTLPAGQTKLKELNVFGNKHVPDLYLQGSIDQRLELLRGLMDTDGSVTRSGSCEFYQKSENLIDQVRTLLASLGIKSRKRFRKFNDCNYWTVSFSTTISVFNLPRKKQKQKCFDHPKNKRLYIKEIRPVKSVPVKCLQVNNESHLFLCGTTLIPTHNTTTVVGLLLWYVLFHEHFSVAILAHKAEQSREILGRLKLAYEHLPKWMQQGIVEWNKGSIELENGSTIIAAATASSAIRGTSQNLVYLDEFAHVPANIQEDFFSSVYPTISSGQTSKVLITSTPNGLNMFYKLWVDSEEKRNSYQRLEIHWSETPGRDEAWKLETIRNTSERQFAQEFECEFLGSTNTLIHPAVLRRLAFREPLLDNQAGLRVYKEKQDGHSYVITVDTSRGVGIDYSAFVVFDITTMPYDIVATYRNDEIATYLYPNILEQSAKYYNNAWVLIETNDLGQQIADILYRELEYEYVFATTVKGRAGVQLSSGFSPVAGLGVRTTKLTKRIGCANLKSLVEGNKLLIPDFNIIQELATFSANKKGSYEAEEGNHDDLVMCLVIFSWLNDQPLMKEITNIDVRTVIYEQAQQQMEEQLLPFGIIDQGTVPEDPETTISIAVDSRNDSWLLDENNHSFFTS